MRNYMSVSLDDAELNHFAELKISAESTAEPKKTKETLAVTKSMDFLQRLTMIDMLKMDKTFDSQQNYQHIREQNLIKIMKMRKEKSKAHGRAEMFTSPHPNGSCVTHSGFFAELDEVSAIQTIFEKPIPSRLNKLNKNRPPKIQITAPAVPAGPSPSPFILSEPSAPLVTSMSPLELHAIAFSKQSHQHNHEGAQDMFPGNGLPLIFSHILKVSKETVPTVPKLSEVTIIKPVPSSIQPVPLSLCKSKSYTVMYTYKEKNAKEGARTFTNGVHSILEHKESHTAHPLYACHSARRNYLKSSYPKEEKSFQISQGRCKDHSGETRYSRLFPLHYSRSWC